MRAAYLPWDVPVDPSRTRKSHTAGTKITWMESNLSEEEDLPMTLHREGILGHDQDRAPRKTDRDEKRGLDVSREVGERARRTQVQPATVRDRRTDVRTDEGGIEL